MQYIKLFESYSAEEYQKVLFKIKSLIQKGKSKDELLTFIGKYTSDDLKLLDNIRLIVDRINETYYPNLVSYNRRTVIKGKRNPKSEDVTDRKPFFIFDRNEKIGRENFINDQYVQYEEVIKKISDDINIDSIKFLMNKLFDLIVWANDTAPAKHAIITGPMDWTNLTNSENKRVREIEDLYVDQDFENEYEELKKLSARIKLQIKKISSNI